MKIILPFPSKKSYREGEPVIQNTIATSYAKDMNLEIFNTIKSIIDRLNVAKGAIYRLGICIPSVCSAHEIETMINRREFEI
jgi:predicted nucleic acid binding AN1-type Zn finger protein